MRNLTMLLLVFLFILIIGCADSEKKKTESSQLNYDQAIQMVKQCVLDLKLYEQEDDIRFIYEPNNGFWNMRGYANHPEMLEMCDLTGKNYYAFMLLDKLAGTRSGTRIIFVDKDKKEIIGVFLEDNFKKTECGYNQKSKKKTETLDYNHAVQVLKKYILEAGLYEGERDIRFIYEPKNGFWNRQLSVSPELLNKHSLTNTTYHAFMLLSEKTEVGRGGTFVFIDKDKRRVIGVLYDDGHFVENTEN